MSGNPNKLYQFWQELKRRRVVHVITVYATAAFVIIELVNNLTEPLNLPPGLSTIVVVILAVGFPLAVILAWIYYLTPEGIEKTLSVEEVGDKSKVKVPNAWRITTYVSFVVIVGLVTLHIVGGPKELRAGDIQSLVILPFDNFTGDDQLEYFVAGMHDSLIGDMGRISGLHVIGKTSANTYKTTEMSAPEIASELDVDAVVETQVMCLGDSICLQVRIVTPFPEEKQLWVGRLQTGRVETSIGRQMVHENINKAFELDPDFADSHFINGIISIWTDWNWEKGEKEFLKALALNPNDVMSRIYYAHLLMILQRNDEALIQGRLAVDLNPLNPLILGLYSVVLQGAGKFQECYDFIQKGLSIDPENGFTRGQLGRAYYHLGEYDKMFEHSKKRLSRLFEPEVIQTIDSIYIVEGFSAAYEKIARQWELYRETHYLAPGSLAWLYYIIGEYENALDDL